MNNKLNRHYNHDMIIAKAKNIELVLFIKSGNPEVWTKEEQSEFPICGNEYFLCLPKFADICLYWLNGGSVKHRLTNINHWRTYFTDTPKHTWMIDTPFMLEECEIVPSCITAQKIVPVEAVQYTGSNIESIIDWLNIKGISTNRCGGALFVNINGVGSAVSPSEYITIEQSGVIWICNEEQFANEFTVTNQN